MALVMNSMKYIKKKITNSTQIFIENEKDKTLPNS